MRRAIALLLAVVMVLFSVSPAFAGTATYAYDDVNRLTVLQSGAYNAVDYSYDSVGNIMGLLS